MKTRSGRAPEIMRKGGAHRDRTKHWRQSDLQTLRAEFDAMAAEEGAAEDDLHGHCPNCGGLGELLGTLGSRTHVRCRGCGLDWSVEAIEEGS